ncbi:MAG: GFA family protein, partial [Solirubrobacteraceae bacterium]
TEQRGLRWYLADGRERGFCAECGASLFWRETGSDQISIAAGTVDEPTGPRTAEHIFTAGRGDYYEIADDLPQHAGGGGEPAPPGASAPSAIASRRRCERQRRQGVNLTVITSPSATW